MNLHDPLGWLDQELDRWQSAGLRRRLVERRGPQLPSGIDLAGQSLCNFGSNDYLGLAADPRLARAAAEATEDAGWGSGASPLVSGRQTWHARLEKELAAFEQTEAALLFPTGFAANLGTITALVGREDMIFSDAKNHASIIDGCRLSGATIQIYPHANVDSLADLLKRATNPGRCLIVTDSLFSMDGDLARLADLAALAEQHRAMLMIDEAHATGVFGASGRGVAEHLNAEDGIHVRVGTCSKALGSLGGFVSGSQRLIDWLANRARPYVFSTAIPAAACAATLAALQIVRDEPHRRQILLDRATIFRDQLRNAGWRIGSCQSQIVPIILGDPDRTMEFASQLRAEGMFVPGIRPPTVPEGESLLRISLSYSHDEQMLAKLLDALASLQ
jgi:8-amino-7-oxononanoate synthase